MVMRVQLPLSAACRLVMGCCRGGCTEGGREGEGSPSIILFSPTHTHTHCHTERGRVLRLAITSAQRLVTKGQLHPARIVTRCNSLVPLGGPALCGLNRRPYFACRNALHTHILQLAEYNEHAWTVKVGILRTHATRSYAYRATKVSSGSGKPQAASCAAGQSVDWVGTIVRTNDVRQRGGRSSSSIGADFFPIIGAGKLPQRPYTGTRRHTTAHRATQPLPLTGQSQCSVHFASACMTCKRLRRSAEECCKLGHHADEHVARRPQLQLCPLHSLPPCPRCTLKQRGVRHCCQRGHHKVCTPVPTHRKRVLPAQSLQPHKKPCLQRPTRHPPGLLRSPHQPVTPPAPKRRRPKTPPPWSPPVPVPQGAGGDCSRGRRPPAFSGEARESQHSGYLTSKIQRF